MHENFICLSGLRDLTEIAHVGGLNTGKVYNSKHICLLHANCYAIPCAWPIDQMLYDWNNKSKCKSAILREATTCYKCSAEGKYLCVFGGHMLCENHVEPFAKPSAARLKAVMWVCLLCLSSSPLHLPMEMVTYIFSFFRESF